MPCFGACAQLRTSARNAIRGALGLRNFTAGGRATEYLLDLGPRKFALISGRLASDQRARQLHQGLLETVVPRGGRLSRDSITEADYGFTEGYERA
jgi:DNA-binding LacI/PurR family transcriptional regulator